VISPFWITLATSTGLGFVVLGLLAWEVRVARRRGRTIATSRWTWSNVGCGALRTLSIALLQGTLVGVYMLVASHAPVVWPMVWWAWILGFLAIDLAEYVSHRVSHAVPIMWAMHAVHHQSPEYNLSLNFRLGVLGPLTGFPFHLGLAIVGVPPAMFAILLPLQAAGMVWTHSRFPGTLGGFGLVLNAPAWHRVHHSAELAHRDRNFGAVFIVWDRLFGTFTDGSNVAPRWGIDGEVAPRNPLEANMGPFRELAARVRRTGISALWRS
jgi:sterol desaturase/sphingolipid hydroxylase (fatty acid hydroxylase superfamily)